MLQNFCPAVTIEFILDAPKAKKLHNSYRKKKKKSHKGFSLVWDTPRGHQIPSLQRLLDIKAFIFRLWNNDKIFVQMKRYIWGHHKGYVQLDWLFGKPSGILPTFEIVWFRHVSDVCITVSAKTCVPRGLKAEAGSAELGVVWSGGRIVGSPWTCTLASLSEGPDSFHAVPSIAYEPDSWKTWKKRFLYVMHVCLPIPVCPMWL